MSGGVEEFVSEEVLSKGNKKKFKVLVTTLGRSHFIQVASALVQAGVDATLFQGWIVKKPRESFLLKIAAKIVGRQSLIYGFEKRMTPELQGHMIGDFVSECVDALGKMMLRKLGYKAWNFAVKMGFFCHGRRTCKLLKKTKYDVFHVKSGLGAGGAIEIAHKKGLKVLVDHGAGAPQFVVETVDCKTWGRWSFWWTVMQDCLKADLLMVVSDWVKQTFLMYGYPEEKIRVVYMGLDLKFNGLKQWDDDLDGIGRSPEKPLRVVFTGGFDHHKGNEYFLGAVERLLDSGRCFSFMAIGSHNVSDEQRAKYPRAVAAIDFKGHLPQDEMCRLMVDSHVYLFPSLSEGCAKSAYEALSMGLCVVCTKETGLPMTDGKEGFLIKSRDIDSIAERLLWLIDNPLEMRRAGEAGTELMKGYTWEAYAENVKKVYEELVAGR